LSQLEQTSAIMHYGQLRFSFYNSASKSKTVTILKDKTLLCKAITQISSQKAMLRLWTGVSSVNSLILFAHSVFLLSYNVGN